MNSPVAAIAEGVVSVFPGSADSSVIFPTFCCLRFFLCVTRRAEPIALTKGDFPFAELMLVISNHRLGQKLASDLGPPPTSPSSRAPPSV